MCSIGFGFSYELSNGSMDYSLSNDEIILLNNGEVYFDSNAIEDGDGSHNNPYKYLNSSSLSNCSIAYLRSGLYNYNSDELNISSDLSFVGESQDNTFIINIKVNNRQEYNSSGQAKLNINLMPGEYIITSSYGGSSISNTIKITG